MLKEHWGSLMKMLGVALAVGGWAMGATFSVDGFNVQIKDKSWMGWALAFGVTGVEIWVNYHRSKGSNLSLDLVIGWLAAYSYDIFTNVAGIASVRATASIMTNPGAFVFPIVLGALLAFLPEPILVLSLTGDSFGSFIQNLLTGTSPASGMSIPKPGGGTMGFQPSMPPAMTGGGRPRDPRANK